MCFGYFRPIEDNPGWQGCNCGVRRPTMEIIKLDDYLTSSGKYPDRMKSDECTKEVKDCAVLLLNKVNQLLKELNISSVSVSSGFRTSAANAAAKGSAKKSLHMLGRAVDIADAKHELYKKIEAKPELLKKYGLWMEHKEDAPTWCHLDDSTTRSDRPVRIFKA